MATNKSETLSNLFAALLAERERTWEPERLARNAAERRDLVDRFDPARIAQPAERLVAATLRDTAGGELALDRLTADGPAVLLFFRFGECPACNIALPHYDRHLRPVLEAAGIPLVAVSPQLPDRLAAFAQRRELGLKLASDPDNRLARRLGITFVPADLPDSPPPPGWIGELTGTGTWELPQPAVLVLERDAVIRALRVSPDWLDRPEVDDILALLAPELERRAA